MSMNGLKIICVHIIAFFLLSQCNSQHAGSVSEDHSVIDSTRNSDKMSEYLKKGRVPRDTKNRLKDKQMDHWDEERSLLQFQMISRSRNTQHDYSWNLLSDDTLVYYSKNTEQPASFSLQEMDAQLEDLFDQLEQAEFWKMKSYYGIPDTKGGDYYLLKARQDQKTKEVIFEAYSPDLIAFLKEFSMRFREKDE